MRSSSPALWWSRLVIAKKLEQRFGLIGMARLLKLIELVLERAPEEGPLSAVLAWGDFMGALSLDTEGANAFLTYCEHARVLDRGNEDGCLQVTLVGELVAHLRPVEAVDPQVGGRVLYATDKQWAAWFRDDLNCPPYLVNDPLTRQLFRRWCATNVTVDEIEDAAKRALEAGQAPVPATLHDHLKIVRQTKIARAVG